MANVPRKDNEIRRRNYSFAYPERFLGAKEEKGLEVAVSDRN